MAKKHILLIDDIFTTGATARSVAQVLMRAGAANVWVATLARARRDLRSPAHGIRHEQFREIRAGADEGRQ